MLSHLKKALFHHQQEDGPFRHMTPHVCAMWGLLDAGEWQGLKQVKTSGDRALVACELYNLMANSE